MDLLDATISLIQERLPLGYSLREARPECNKLAALFIAEDDWAQSLDGKIEDLDELSTRVVEWVRARGYPILDEPPSPYSMTSSNLGTWGPSVADVG